MAQKQRRRALEHTALKSDGRSALLAWLEPLGPGVLGALENDSIPLQHRVHGRTIGTMIAVFLSIADEFSTIYWHSGLRWQSTPGASSATQQAGTQGHRVLI